MHRLCGVFSILIVSMRFNFLDMRLVLFTRSWMPTVKEDLIIANTGHSLHLTMKFVSFSHMVFQD